MVQLMQFIMNNEFLYHDFLKLGKKNFRIEHFHRLINTSTIMSIPEMIYRIIKSRILRYI